MKAEGNGTFANIDIAEIESQESEQDSTHAVMVDEFASKKLSSSGLKNEKRDLKDKNNTQLLIERKIQDPLDEDFAAIPSFEFTKKLEEELDYEQQI